MRRQTTGQRRHWVRAAIGLAILAGAGTGAGAEPTGQADLELGAALLDGLPAAAATAAFEAEAFAGPAAARGALRLEGRAGNDAAGSAEARTDLSLSSGSLTSLLRLEGGLSGATDVSPSWRGAGGLVLSLDGLDLSAKAEAALERRSDAGVLSWQGRSGFELSGLVGEILLKPGVEASVALPDGGAWSLSLLPGLGLSWYPGFPLSASLSAGWRRDFAGTATLDSMVGAASLYAATGPLLLTAEGSATLSTAGLGAASASLGLSPDLGRLGSARLAAPIRVSWVLGGTPVLSLFAGLSLAFD